MGLPCTSRAGAYILDLMDTYGAGKLFFRKLIWKNLKDSKKLRTSGILLPKLFWPTMRKNCFSDREKLLKFEAEGQGFANFLRSQE